MVACDRIGDKGSVAIMRSDVDQNKATKIPRKTRDSLEKREKTNKTYIVTVWRGGEEKQ